MKDFVAPLIQITHSEARLLGWLTVLLGLIGWLIC